MPASFCPSGMFGHAAVQSVGGNRTVHRVNSTFVVNNTFAVFVSSKDSVEYRPLKNRIRLKQLFLGMEIVATTSPASTRARIAVSSHLRTMALLWTLSPCLRAGTCSSPTLMTRPVRALCTTPNTYSGTTTNSCAASSLSTCFIGKNGSQLNDPP